MAKKKIYGVFDTETIGVEKKWVYDIGLVIIGRKGEPLFAKDWIIKEIIEIPDIQKIAFYGNKIKTFYANKERIPFSQARDEFCQLLEDYEVDATTAYNMQFDMSALGDTCRLLKVSKKFLKKRIEFFDLWNATCDSLFQQKRFKRIAIEQNWITEKGNFRTSAEVAYRFITGDYGFIESHTALDDALIESKILQQVLKQKKKIIRNEIIHHPWKKVKRIIPQREYSRDQLQQWVRYIMLTGSAPHPADIVIKDSWDTLDYGHKNHIPQFHEWEYKKWNLPRTRKGRELITNE